MLFDSGVGVPHKVLKAYISEVGWLAEPIRGRKAQPLWELAQPKGIVEHLSKKSAQNTMGTRGTPE